MDKDHPYIPQRGRPRKTKEDESVSDVLKKIEVDKIHPNNIKRELGFTSDRSFKNIVLDPILHQQYEFNRKEFNPNQNNIPYFQRAYEQRRDNEMNLLSAVKEKNISTVDVDRSMNCSSMYNPNNDMHKIEFNRVCYNNPMINEPMPVDNEVVNNNLYSSPVYNNLRNTDNLTNFVTNKFTGTSLGQTLSHQSNATNFDTDPNNLPYQNYSLWVNRKKRKNNPLLWQYINQSFVHPSKLSSVDYVQKRFLGTFTQPVQEKNNYQVLPLFLNSSSHSHEFESIAKLFLEKTDAVSYDNITVMQLKNLMKEFGLCHNGKKTELIDRLRATIERIKNKLHNVNKKEDVPEEEFSYF